MFINVLNAAALSVFIFALTAGPCHLLLWVEFLLFVLSVVVRYAHLYLFNSLLAVGLQSELLVFRCVRFESLLVDEARDNRIQRLFTSSWVLLPRLLAKSRSQLSVIFFLLTNLSRDLAAQKLWCHILFDRLIENLLTCLFGAVEHWLSGSLEEPF